MSLLPTGYVRTEEVAPVAQTYEIRGTVVAESNQSICALVIKPNLMNLKTIV